MEFDEIASGIARLVVEPAHVTIGLISGRDSAAIIDTGSSPEQGQAILAAAREATGLPVSQVIMTHGHWDHSFGLAGFGSIPSLAHETTPELIRSSANIADAGRYDVHLKQAPALPTDTIVSLAFRDLGDKPIEIAHFGPAHTPGDLIIAVPDCQVFFVGDLIEEPPQFDDTTSLFGWVDVLDGLNNLMKLNSIVIPGHGDPVGPAEVARARAGLAAITAQCEWLFRQGVPVDEAYGYDDLQWPWDPAVAQAGIAVAYRELATRPKRPEHSGPMF